MRRPWTAGFACFLGLGLGCGGGKVAPVSGRITLDGEPLANASVTFQPMAQANNPNPGPGSSAITDAEGRYTLEVVGWKRKGAIIGKHRVSIIAYQGGALPKVTNDFNPQLPPQIVPRRYNSDTELEIDVLPGGTDAADFPLTSKELPK